MSGLLLGALLITLGLIGPAMAQERILISSGWGKVTAELGDNEATRSLVQMLVRLANEGNVAAAKEVLDRCVGRPLEADLLERIEALEAHRPEEAPWHP